MPVRQKLGMILENKVVQKLKLEKNVFSKNHKAIKPHNLGPLLMKSSQSKRLLGRFW